MFSDLSFPAQLGVWLGIGSIVLSIIYRGFLLFKALRRGEITADDLINAPTTLPPGRVWCDTCRTYHDDGGL